MKDRRGKWKLENWVSVLISMPAEPPLGSHALRERTERRFTCLGVLCPHSIKTFWCVYLFRIFNSEGTVEFTQLSTRKKVWIL